MDHRRFTLVEILIVVAILGLLIAIVIPGFVQSGRDTRTASCVNNLRVVDYAQQQTMLQYNTDSPTAEQVNSFLRAPDPVCPASNQAYVLTTCPPVCPAVAKYPNHVH